MNQKTKDAFREKWKLRDPIGFAAQEARRKHYLEMKKKGGVSKASEVMPVLQCKLFFDSENETFYDDPYDIDDPTVSWSLEQGNARQAPQFAAAAVPIPKHGIIITGAIVAQLVLSATSILDRESVKRPARGIGTLLVELWASDDSEWTK